MPALADSGSAQRAFRTLDERWQATPPDQYADLVPEFRTFLQTFPNDDQGRVARVYLAWLLVYTGELVEARELVEQTRRGPAGTAADFAQVVEAALLVRYRQPHEALKLLRPLQGKLIDSVEAFYGTQQLVQSAMAANLYAEALSHVVDWLLQAPPSRRAQVREEVQALVKRVPRRYLERALVSERPTDSDTTPALRVAEQQWFYDVLTAQLGALATATRDRELARRVLEENPTLEADAEEPSALLRLATGVSESAAVVEQTVGLVLNVRTAVGRRRSNQVVSGLAQTLALLSEPPDAAPGNGDRGASGLDLVVTDDAEDLEQGLAEAAARGAPLLLTGMTVDDATKAARFAARERIPVLLFVPPRVTTNYAFVLGVGDLEQQRSAQEKLGEAAALVTELECEVAAESTSATGFPLTKWAAEGRSTLVLLGDSACSKRALSEARHAAFSGEVWFGLESGHLWPGASAAGFRTLQAGRFPLTPGALPRATQLALKLGHQPTWFETLGHDSAIVLRDVFETLPRVRLQDDSEVAGYHARVLEGLGKFTSEELWSSTDARFDDDMQLERTLNWQ